MTRRISIRDVRANLSDVVGSVYYTKEPVILERKGRPMAVLISPDQYEGYAAYVKSGFDQAVDRVRERNEARDPDTVYADVTEIVEEVRRERFERQPAKGDQSRR